MYVVGSLLARRRVPEGPAARLPEELLERDDEAAPSNTAAGAQDDVVPHRVAQWLRLPHVLDAFEERHAAAHAEIEHGDDEAPEVQLLAMPERVLLVGWALAQLMPTSSSTPLPVSTAEWMPSDSIAELPVMPATIQNFITATALLTSNRAIHCLFRFRHQLIPGCGG